MCAALEAKLGTQNATVEALENSRRQFHTFAQKYEAEITKRDVLITSLRASGSPASLAESLVE